MSNKKQKSDVLHDAEKMMPKPDMRLVETPTGVVKNPPAVPTKGK